MTISTTTLGRANYHSMGAQFDIGTMPGIPTHTDVLLGRGVATNRHLGNANFRSIVSQYVGAYTTSTKKQKMMISRSIVDKVRTELNPPGRFLEKNPMTGLWHEVGDKKALEKTAQKLRDGAALLRKQLTEDASDLSFFDTLLDGDNIFAEKSLGQPVSSKGKKRQRRKSDPTMSLSSGTIPLRPKRKRSNPDIGGSDPRGSDPIIMDNWSMPGVPSMGQSQLVQQQHHHLLLPQHPLLPFITQSQTSPDMPNTMYSNIGQMQGFMPSVSPDQACKSSQSMSEALALLATNQISSLQDPGVSVYNTSFDEEEEFAKEMGADEHFMGLCDSNPIDDCFDFDEDINSIFHSIS